MVKHASTSKQGALCGAIDASWNKGNSAIHRCVQSSDSADTSLAHLSSADVLARKEAKLLGLFIHSEVIASDRSQALSILPSLREKGERNPGPFDLRTEFL